MQPKVIHTTTASGAVRRIFSPGSLGFKIMNQYYRLDVTFDYPNSYWIIFADETSGDETYGGGRLIGVEKPDERGTTVIDFNKAFNLPCVLSEYYSCPLPPPQNMLPIKVTAGEKKYKNK